MPGSGGSGGNAGYGAADAETFAVVAALCRDHPRWAVWPPASPGGQWTAVRPAGSRSPGPEVPMVWVQAATTVELGEGMRHADAALKPGD